ncbi:hypothetical protein [Pseudomonas sp.]|uniref:hypothetical protein n=1 Tax=Pseudomonas sp. TaxID=306 RepID=UPI002608333F|nr:hypothetical protein [Pseudomonas sp.]
MKNPTVRTMDPTLESEYAEPTSDTGTSLSAEQVRIRNIIGSRENSAFLKHLFSPGVQKALYSRSVIDFVIAYGKATHAHLPIAEATRQQCYEQKITEGFSVEHANQAAQIAWLNEYLTVPFPALGHAAPASDTEEVLCTPTAPKSISHRFTNSPEGGQS